MSVPAAKDLFFRYLLWCYKTTREDLDWIDRKFTQLQVDEAIREQLVAGRSAEPADPGYDQELAAFDQYISDKQAKAAPLKYTDPAAQTTLQPRYRYLRDRLAAIEWVITDRLGAEELPKIRGLYEQEMVGRILAAREHR